MPPTTDPIAKLILDSKALSIWNHKTGPVFWYAAGVPGPFYLNTELMIGRDLADDLLEKITAIIAEESEPKARAERLHKLIMDAYRRNPDYITVVQAMIEKAKAEFPAGSYTIISGGERRDWLFSIPFAAEAGLRHLYLFKNGRAFCGQPLKDGEKALHISDLINNAASYFNMWLPALQKAKLACPGTLTVNTRGTVGIKKLEDAGYKVAALNRVDLPFFAQLRASGLIGQDVLDEITVYFASPQEWAAKYLMNNALLFRIDAGDKKAPERLRSFFTQDPWGLSGKFSGFFEEMRKA